MLVQASMIVMQRVSGRLSDLVQRRKSLRACRRLDLRERTVVVAAADCYQAFLVGMALTGVGHGVYFAVDLALVTDVLPDKEHHAAKDLGVLNVANALPQSVAPAIATRDPRRRRRRLLLLVPRRGMHLRCLVPSRYCR